MRFDFCIGNPPYQDETLGDNKGFAPPVYHLFLDNAYAVCDAVEMIHPARFLFNAGTTPKAWNARMLNERHLKVLLYEPNCKTLFPNTEINGGLAITYYDKTMEYGAIGTFTAYPALNSIIHKVKESNGFLGMSSIAVSSYALDILLVNRLIDIKHCFLLLSLYVAVVKLDETESWVERGFFDFSFLSSVDGYSLSCMKCIIVI